MYISEITHTNGHYAIRIRLPLTGSAEQKRGIKTPAGLAGVWLDTPLLETIHGKGTLENNFPAMLRQFSRFGIDCTGRYCSGENRSP